MLLGVREHLRHHRESQTNACCDTAKTWMPGTRPGMTKCAGKRPTRPAISLNVIASVSEAIHAATWGKMDCFVAALLAMTA